MGEIFRFRHFELLNEGTGHKVGTDGVLLGAVASLGAPPLKVLDIGTGTGVVALMIAQRLFGTDNVICRDGNPASSDVSGIYAIEIDAGAASVAAGNFASSPWASVLHCVHSSLRDYADMLYRADDSVRGTVFDKIVCNPPYYDDSLASPDAKRNVARHTGSLSYREVITFANDFLRSDGSLSLILPKQDESALLRFASSFGFFPTSILNLRTSDSKPVSRIVVDFGRVRGKTAVRTMAIRDSGGFTGEYKALTADFYL